MRLPSDTINPGGKPGVTRLESGKSEIDHQPTESPRPVSTSTSSSSLQKLIGDGAESSNKLFLAHKKVLPGQSAGKPYYRYIFPVFCFMLTCSIAVIWPLRGAGVALLTGTAAWYCGAGFVVTLVASIYYTTYRCWELRDGMSPSSRPEFSQYRFNHVVVVCAYKEPLEVLQRTLASIIAQEGLADRKPTIVMAMEVADPTRHAVYALLETEFGSRCQEIMMTEHLITPGEVAGKASNENHSVRETYRELVEARGMDPFTIMLTIVDADSILAPAYLNRVEDKYWDMHDGRRMIYNGPLNVYRNICSTNILIQFYEIGRSHVDCFKLHHLNYTPQSNYSLTLGFAAELDFWTADNISEDQQTRIKAMVNNFASGTTVFVPSYICNDLVEGASDRYVQAKRHQWGGVESTGYLLALYSVVDFRVWLKLWSYEMVDGQAFKIYHSMMGMVVIGIIFGSAGFCMLLQFTCAYMTCEWVVFWAAEAYIWNIVIKKQFPVERPSTCNWIMLVALSPLLELVSRFVYAIFATLHCMVLAMFQDTFVYVNAPKGSDNERARTDALGMEASVTAEKK